MSQGGGSHQRPPAPGRWSRPAQAPAPAPAQLTSQWKNMASVVCRFSRLSALRNAAVLTRSAGPKRPDAPQCRNAVATSTGAILPKPVKISFGLIRLAVVVVPFLYVGTLISKNFAALLEEHDIFVPEDDDDDD